MKLHYIEQGKGVPIVFVHGGLEDYTLWENQVREFGQKYRAIAYSRRLNYPNKNATVSDYSAAKDAENVAALIQQLGLGKCHIVGFSYGGTAAMYLAIRHPGLVRTLTLCEPALIPWLESLSVAKNAQKGKQVYADYQTGLVVPTKEAFERDDTEGALRATLDYLSGPGMYDKAAPELKSLWKRNAEELKAILTSPEGLSAPDPEDVRQLKMPILLLSGGKSADSCQL